MTPQELRESCSNALAKNPAIDMIVLIMPGNWGKRDTRYLSGQGSPLGHILSDHFGPGGGICVEFKASEILAWLDKMEGKS